MAKKLMKTLEPWMERLVLFGAISIGLLVLGVNLFSNMPTIQTTLNVLVGLSGVFLVIQKITKKQR